MSSNKTKNFSQKGFTGNFLAFMKKLEKNELCCLDFLEQVFTEDSASFHFLGKGTELDPLSGDVKLSAASGNALTINSDGIFVPTSMAGGLTTANDGLRTIGTNVVFGDDATNVGPANQLIDKVYNQNGFNFFWLTSGNFFNITWDATIDMDPGNNSEIFGANVINKVQRNDTQLIYERKVVNITPTNTIGTGVYHLTVDTEPGMPAGISAALFGGTTSIYSFLMQMTTDGPNLNWSLAGPTIGGRTFNKWLSVVNAQNPIFSNPPIPFTSLGTPLMIYPSTNLGGLSHAYLSGFTFGVDCDSKSISLINILTVSTGSFVLIEDGSGNYSRITLANLRTAMGL